MELLEIIQVVGGICGFVALYLELNEKWGLMTMKFDDGSECDWIDEFAPVQKCEECDKYRECCKIQLKRDGVIKWPTKKKLIGNKLHY